MLVRFALCLTILFAIGCAKFPDSGSQQGTRRLIFTIEMASEINPDFVYIVAIRDGDDLTGQEGPIPVIAPPWGNGFVAGKATHFVRFDGDQPNGGYGLYRFTDTQNLSSWILLGVPISFQTPGPGERTLRFEIDLTQLRPNPADALNIQALQINLLTMDRVPTDPNDNDPKTWDALGNSRDINEISSYLTIFMTPDRIYRNSDTNLEPEGDTDDPRLDIVDWTIEVRSLQ
ncbi:MAG: hypothetical protein D6724_09685 [Armatimonadetes bacterium]|nr:MAG: hypothetical protein D6724_09685 [Armatimonadota bacterium]